MNARPHPASTASALGLALLVGGCRTAVPPAPPSAAALAAAPVDVQTPPTQASVAAAMTRVADWQLASPSRHRPYEPVILRGWAALNRAVREDGMLGYVQPAGAAPGATGPDQTEIYGAGAFILAGSEPHRLLRR